MTDAIKISPLKEEYLNYVLKEKHLTAEQKEQVIQRILLPDFNDFEINIKLRCLKAKENSNKCITCDGHLDYTWHGPECNNDNCVKNK